MVFENLFEFSAIKALYNLNVFVVDFFHSTCRRKYSFPTKHAFGYLYITLIVNEINCLVCEIFLVKNYMQIHKMDYMLFVNINISLFCKIFCSLNP